MFDVRIYSVDADAELAHTIRDAYGNLRDRVRAHVLDEGEIDLPDVADGMQEGTCVVIVSSHLLGRWFRSPPWAQAISRWQSVGGRALIVHPDTSSGPLDWPAVTLGSAGETAGSEMLEEFLDVRRSMTLRFDARDVDDRRGALEHARGLAAWMEEDIERARAHFQEAVSLRRHELHEGDPRLAASENAFGVTLVRMGELEDAVAVLFRALERRRLWLGTGAPQAAVSANNLGAALARAGDLVAAAAAFDAAADAMIALGPSYAARARMTASNAAATFARAGNGARAEAWRLIINELPTNGGGGAPGQDLVVN